MTQPYAMLVFFAPPDDEAPSSERPAGRPGRHPLRYGGLTDTELAAAVTAWFVRHSDRRDRWNRTATGTVLKARMTALGAFKNRPRGNPVLGHTVMLARRAAREEPARVVRSA